MANVKVTAVNASLGKSVINVNSAIRGTQGPQGIQGVDGADGADGANGVGAPAQTGPFAGEFDMSENISRFYTDYQAGSVVNLSLSATKVFGAIATVRIRGDFLGTIPTSWALSGDAVSSLATDWNEITVLYVTEFDIRAVNRVYDWAESPDTDAPTIPTNLVASAIAATSCTLTWTASTDNIGVANYKVYQDGIVRYSPAATTQGVTGLDPETLYVFRVSAVDAAGNESAQSTFVNVTTAASSSEQAPVLTSALSAAQPDNDAPVLSAFSVEDANTDRITFESDEIITGTTFGGFTLGSGKTVTGISINAGQLTGHYFTVSAAYTNGDGNDTIAYSGTGCNIADVSTQTNALEAFTATTVTNNVSPGEAAPVLTTTLS